MTRCKFETSRMRSIKISFLRLKLKPISRRHLQKRTSLMPKASNFSRVNLQSFKKRLPTIDLFLSSLLWFSRRTSILISMKELFPSIRCRFWIKGGGGRDDRLPNYRLGCCLVSCRRRSYREELPTPTSQ